MAGAAASIDLQLMRAAALLDDDPAAAGREAAKILAEHPGHAAAALLLATARRNCGEVSEATSAFAELAAARPDSALLQLELGRSHAAQGRPADALAAFERAVELEPNLAEAWRELSMLHAAQGETLACDVAYARYTRLAPPEQHLAEAANALANERHAAAEALLLRRLSDAPDDVAAMRLLAEAVAEREDYVEAERLLGECLRLAPGYGSARHDLARTLHNQQKAAPMLPVLERLLAHQPRDLYFRSLQSSAYSMLGQNEKALEILAGLLEDFPENERVWLAYGHQMRVAGRQPEAIVSYRKSIALKPECGEAWFCLANLKTFRFTAEDVAAMREQLTRGEIPDGQRLQFEFALGKALEDAGEYADSFVHYASGNALRRAAISYDLSNSTRLVERSVKLYTREFFAARSAAGCAAPDPIFIVGLPRAGSTLLEQILASHSQVEGTRELPDIPGFALELGILETRDKPATYPLAVAEFTPAQLTALGERYLAQVGPHRREGRPHFIDKMPSNLLHVGLIHLILPNARIIDARRSPLGCCFANFKQHFQAGNWFSYSLQDLGRYYRDYVHLMGHFDAVLPGRVHRVYYEDIVADLEGEVRRLLNYCGLPFEEGCLRFHENRRLVQTASSEQVRRPIYGDSVDQWRHFEPWLGELKEALGDVVEQYAARPRRST